jgi:signal transduction histidine kinase
VPVDLERLLRKLAGEVAATATADIRVDGPGHPVLVDGDPARLSRMFAELLDNAVRHAPDHTWVTVTLAVGGDGCDVHVDDSGPGIPDPDRRKLVFEPFFQTGHVLTDKPAGLGLGLTIARETALLHGGSIECATSPGGGARFTVHLRRPPATGPGPEAAATPPPPSRS